MSKLSSSMRRFKSGVFQRYTRRPFGRGYLSYRQTQLPQYVTASLPPDVLPEGWGLWLDERAVEYPWFFSRLPAAEGRLLDAGSVLNYDFVLSHPKLKNKAVSILTLAPEADCYWRRGISYVYGDIRDCCFRDNYFDWIACISTLEHVGMDNTQFYTADVTKNEHSPESQLQALAELRRVLKPGGVLYLTVPCGRAADHGWLQVFDATRVQMLLDAFRPEACRTQYFRYTSAGWNTASADECSEARYFDSSQQDGSLTELAAAEAVVCLELAK
ncbi:MAG TPA: class I SAM-dependent methyltransferase [Terriglobales bacterium]|nr:class I SAM-dependent methyltransferase [Terriglobales bacterium]